MNKGLLRYFFLTYFKLKMESTPHFSLEEIYSLQEEQVLLDPRGQDPGEWCYYHGTGGNSFLILPELLVYSHLSSLQPIPEPSRPGLNPIVG